MQKLGFEIEKKFYLFQKEYKNLNTDFSLNDFIVESLDLSYERFSNLPYIKRRDNLIDLAFVLEEPSIELYNELKET